MEIKCIKIIIAILTLISFMIYWFTKDEKIKNIAFAIEMILVAIQFSLN